MHDDKHPGLTDYSGQPKVSTTWAHKRVRIKRPAGGQTQQSAEGRPTPARRRVALRWRHLSRADKRRNLTVTLRYRGGAECWVEVKARGSFGRFHGATALIDVLEEIVGGADYNGPSSIL